MEEVVAPAWTMTSADLVGLIDALRANFDEVIAPVLVDGVIRLEPIDSADDLPTGATDDQRPGSYRAAATGGDHRFSYAVGPDSLKALVHPPRSPVWTMDRDDSGAVSVSVAPIRPSPPSGARRSCV